MYRKEITYRDYEGNLTTDTLWFALNQVELIDMENDIKRGHGDKVDKNIADKDGYLVAYLDMVQKTADTSAAADFIKDLIKRSYGIKSTDGKRFIKNEEAFTEFTQTAAYPAFYMLVATNLDEAKAFMEGIPPQEMREQAQNMSTVGRAKQAANISALPRPESAGGPIPVVEQVRIEPKNYPGEVTGPTFYNN